MVVSALLVSPEDVEQREVEKNISRAPFLLIYEVWVGEDSITNVGICSEEASASEASPGKVNFLPVKYEKDAVLVFLDC